MGQSHYHTCLEVKAFYSWSFLSSPHFEAGVIERIFSALLNVPTMAEFPLSCEQQSH